MARPEGFEPPAPRFVVWCSIQLSYGRAGTGDIGAGHRARNPRPRRQRPVLPERETAHRRKPMKLRQALPGVAALVAGCVSQGPFPSLAPRPAERQDWSEEPVRAAPAVADDPALRRRVDALLEQASAGERSFEADYAAAERLAAHAGREGSDSWIEAQQAISRLVAARAATGEALAELHQLRLARAAQPTSSGDLAGLDAAIAEAEQTAAHQQQRIERISPR